MALCGTRSVSRALRGSLQRQIRSRLHGVRRRDLALPKTLNLLVEGSIPSGLTKSSSIPSVTSRSTASSRTAPPYVPCGTRVAFFRRSLVLRRFLRSLVFSCSCRSSSVNARSRRRVVDRRYREVVVMFACLEENVLRAVADTKLEEFRVLARDNRLLAREYQVSPAKPGGLLTPVQNGSSMRSSASVSRRCLPSTGLWFHRGGTRMLHLMPRYPRRLSRRSSRSNPVESPRRLSKILRATSRRAPTSGSRSAYRTANPSFWVATMPW